ncbi:hypothetical protein [Rubrivirga sp. IMCC45206]|uniref:hypothetical protein n=1 Tax=Rubrivirga sp. IMCC45206 TaxID=3391614 RepID=UPI00398F99E4
MTPGRILFVGLLLLAGLLFVLNPGPDRFQEYLQEEAAERAGRRGSTGFLNERLGRVAGGLADDAFEREDLYLASIYEADLNGRMPGGEWRYLGVAGWFFVLDSPVDEE